MRQWINPHFPTVSQWWRPAPNGSRNRAGTWVVGTFEANEHRFGQSRHGSGNPAEQNHAFLIGNRRHRIDHVFGWRSSQHALE
jgi:hypothetical protein